MFENAVIRFRIAAIVGDTVDQTFPLLFLYVVLAQSSNTGP